MRNLLHIFTVISLLLFGSSVFGQSLEEERGDKHLESFEFENAIEDYVLAYEFEPENAKITRKIADAYRRKGDLSASTEWYEKTLALDDSKKEDMLYYAEALKTQKRYSESLEWYEKYNALTPEDERAENHLENTTYYEELTEDSVMFVVKKLNFNNRKPAFGVTKYNEKLVFSAAGIDGKKFQQKNPWNDLPYLDIYEANTDESNEVVDIEPINALNSKYNDGPAHYDDISNTMFVTRNNMKRGKPVKDKTGSVNLKIYTSTQVDGKWGEISELPFNSDDYSTGHPAISADGSMMYFASNRPNGEGGTDIYSSEKVNGVWSFPTNMGKGVNTKGDEMFPYIDDNNILYFSSTGHVGLGGLDIFKIDLDSLNSIDPENVGYPINSSKDDFSIVFEQTDISGYFCSNRDKGYSDDVFYFEINQVLQKIYAGRIESSLPDKSLAGKELIIRNKDTQEEVVVILDENGGFEFGAIPGDSYELAYQKEDSEEIITQKTVEDVVSVEYENMGIFTIQERLDVTFYDDKEELDVNGVLFKRLSEEGKFVSENGEEFTNTQMLDKITSNLDGNSIQFNNELYNINPNKTGYAQEDGEPVSEDELEKLIISEIFANPLDTDDDSLLAGMTTKVDDLDGMLGDIDPADLGNMTALEYVERALQDDQLTEDEKLQLEGLKTSDLEDIAASDWLEYVFSDDEVAENLSHIEKKALNMLDTDLDLDMASEEAPKTNVDDYALPEALNIANEEDFMITSKEELKVALTNRQLDNIYFDFDKNSIRKDARETLDEIAALLLVNKGLEIYVNAHTDSRGSNPYNDALSEKRAHSVEQYLAARGVDPNKLKLSWYGEEQLTNECVNDIDCEENAHQMNRRASFALVGEVTHSASNGSDVASNTENSTATEQPAETAISTEDIAETTPEESTSAADAGAGLEMIYFDFDDAKIRQDASTILKVVAESMKTNGKSVVINAHTDSRGSNAYNQMLSERRAESTKAYLENLGISADRISINWAGETQLTNSCGDGVKCNANNHQLNRRAALVWK